MLHTAHNTLHTEHFDTVHLTLRPLDTVHLTLRPSHSTLHATHFTGDMQQLLPVHRFARDPAAYCIKTCAWFSSTVPLQLTVNVRYNFTFHSPHCKRHTSHCTLQTAPLFTFRTSHFNIHTSHCQRHITYGTLHTSHCTLQHCTLQHITPVSHFTLHILHCTLHNTPLTLHPSHFTFQGCQRPGLGSVCCRHWQRTTCCVPCILRGTRRQCAHRGGVARWLLHV